eukprot:gb/GFBE01065538.1/.p1 GENE.gb/GFBE01065538.1/~~gb/GFBE01065538.1/.p1  ORF type:complete len:249 (+),score=33.00 gb/GFBE01065538.1/:1-747(+)
MQFDASDWHGPKVRLQRGPKPVSALISKMADMESAVQKLNFQSSCRNAAGHGYRNEAFHERDEALQAKLHDMGETISRIGSAENHKLQDERPPALSKEAAEEAYVAQQLQRDYIPRGLHDSMEAWLIKRGPNKQDSWLRRWCVLEPYLFSWFEDESRQACLGHTMLLQHSRAVPFARRDAPGRASMYFQGRPYGFVLDVDPSKGSDRELLYFDAASAERLRFWVDVIGGSFLVGGHGAGKRAGFSGDA